MSGKKLPYDVFINHRGPDVKQTLAATLYNTLSAMGFRVFLDKEEFQLGDYLPKEIGEAMHSASLHIAIFSQSYAQSPWCLVELSYMLNTGTQIIPIFYYLQPVNIVSYNVGEILNNKDDEGRLVKNIVNRVLKVIKNVPFVVAEHPVGLDEAVIDFERTTLQSTKKTIALCK
ncbi:hypothetical protein SUGI_0961020 [Cryptomeria japonica]|nr:hypothetical protein SUGI_0961020 [Cryptomeria japonica]